jgi:hypothetical protein
MLRLKSTQELKKVQEMRERIDEILNSKKAKEKQVEGELKNYQTMNKSLMN